jgi:folate-binding protein YgfZ
MPERYAVWLDRDVVSASGPESGTFLQGQLSQDVLALPEGGSAWSWLLAPTGKVDALLRVTRLAADDWLLDTDLGWGKPVIERLTRFRLRTKVDLAARPWQVLGLRGDAAGFADDAVTVPAWPGLAGVDRIGPALTIPEGWPVMPAAEYEAVRILAGIPKMGTELTDKTIPGETGLIERTVSFTKGCYTGQELVARIDSRGGHVPRRLHALVLTGPVEPGTTLVDGSGRTAGMVTSVAYAPATGWVALGYVRRGVDFSATLRAGPDGPEVEVREPG